MSVDLPASKFLRALLLNTELTPSGLFVTLNTEKVKLACVSKGWSLMELARKAEVSRPTLAAIMRGQRVRPRTAFKLSDALRRGESLQDGESALSWMSVPNSKE
jgi:hypothetical protein